MASGTFRSANGVSVKIGVEIRNDSGVFGKDFISGGLRDYATKYEQGYWITAKSSVFPSNVDVLLRRFIQEALVSSPITMPEAHASHLVVHIWDGAPRFEEEELLAILGQRIERSEIVEDKERLDKERAKKLADVEKRLAEAKEKLKDVKSKTFSYRRGEKEQAEARVVFFENMLKEMRKSKT